jgi:hypothetical protein
MFFAAVKWVRYGRKLRLYRVEELLCKDPRPPVLYLRPFARDSEAADAETIYEPGYQGQGFRGWLITRTEEEQIVHVLQTIGPVIAIGNPEDKLPELGAARRYLGPGEDWQDVVRQWMVQSCVVVLHAGTSPGLLWELRTVRHMLSHEQLLILLSMNYEEYELFRRKVEDLWSIRFPYSIARPVYGSITGCIYFKPGWQPCFLQMKKPSFYRYSRRPLASLLLITLQPFFDQLRAPA